MKWIWDKILWWTNFGYGEIVFPLRPGWKAVVVIFIHIALVVAILLPVWEVTNGGGILCWALSAFYLLWNLCLDEHGGTPRLREKVGEIEQEAEYIAADSVGNVMKKVFFQYVRVMIPAAFTIICLLIWGILMMKG